MAAAKMKKAEKDTELSFVAISQQTMVVYVRGVSPLISHRLSLEAQKELLLPSKKKNRAEKESTSKHNPLQEYRESLYITRDPKSPTLCVLNSPTFKAAICSAALDMPGAAKSQIGRLTYIEGEEVAIYGTPELKMDDVRNSGMNRTPDIRTRAIFPEWCATFDIRYTVPLLTQESVGKLVGAAGQIVGVGDWRPQKGSGAYGRFEVITEEEYKQEVKTLGKRKEQEAAFQNPATYDDKSRELYDWFKAEAARRGFRVA